MNQSDAVRQIGRALDILGHSLSPVGYTEIRLIDPEGDEPPMRKWFKTGSGAPQLIYDFVAPHEGKRNAYLGRALRNRDGGGDDTSVDFVWAVSIDIDPVRPKGQPATEGERLLATKAGAHIISLVGGASVSSGNGCQVWIPLARQVDIRGRRLWWKEAHRAWEASVVEEAVRMASAYGVQIDPQFDIPRIVCLPGFMKVKGTEDYEAGRTYSDCFIPDGQDYLPMDEEKILSLGPKEESAGARKAGPILPGAPVPPRFWKLLNDDPRLFESYNGERRDLSDTSNSTQNMALLNRLRYHGFTRDEAVAVLMAAPSLKARANEFYINLSVSKVYGA
jgi:hypothetical protein